MTTVEAKPKGPERRVAQGIVDCDVHNALPNKAVLKEHLPKQWHAAYDAHPRSSMHGVSVGARPHHGIFRDDTFPPGGAAPGSSLAMLQEQLLDRYGVTRAILSPLEGIEWVQYGELARELARALNEHIRAEWLDKDDRLFGAIIVPTEDGAGAAAEIRRIAALDDRFVQVLMLIGSREPLGHANYRPIFEAAAECDIPVGIHVAGFPGTTSPVGHMTYQAQRHAVWPSAFQAQAINLVTSGIFDELPNLKIILEEGGFTWIPSLMWRLDRMWPAFREQMPKIKRAPSEIIRDHLWFTTQPIDEPAKPEFMTQTLEQMGMDDRIMFSSDYPHWDFDPPDRILRTEVSAEMRKKVLSGNAEALYRFPS